jgi:hypothetical protein
MNRKFKIKFIHYTLQIVLTTIGVGTAGAIIFTFFTIINERILWVDK